MRVGCTDCSRSFETDRGMRIHRALVHTQKRGGLSRRARPVSAHPSPPIRFAGAMAPAERRRFRAFYTCGHGTLLGRSWNPVVEDPDIGPYEGYCATCDRMLPITHFLEFDEANAAFSASAAGAAP
jgi:hypothetical protein